jgi:hypothetical protein
MEKIALILPVRERSVTHVEEKSEEWQTETRSQNERKRELLGQGGNGTGKTRKSQKVKKVEGGGVRKSFLGFTVVG